jgi:hypothetical protein
MKIKILLFKVHKGDELSAVIQDVTRTAYTHAALLLDETTNEISEAYIPHIRRRKLADTELAGIDVFGMELTPEQEAGILAYCVEAEAANEPYSIENLLRFNPLLRHIFGEAVDVNVHSPVICSQYTFDAFDRGAGVKLLNAPSYEIAPGYLAWSPLLKPQPPLKSLVAPMVGEAAIEAPQAVS